MISRAAFKNVSQVGFKRSLTNYSDDHAIVKNPQLASFSYAISNNFQWLKNFHVGFMKWKLGRNVAG